MTLSEQTEPNTHDQTAKCPVDHHTLSTRHIPFVNMHPYSPVTQDEKGVWHVRDYAAVKQILRDHTTLQAGFSSELLKEMPDNKLLSRLPVLFQDGDAHTEQRGQIVRFFTPKTTRTNYQRIMKQYAHEMLAELYEKGSAELSELSMKMAAGVAAQVVGLTNSLRPDMERRLDQFIRNNSLEQSHISRNRIKMWLAEAGNQKRMLQFLLIDVKPAIAARKKRPQQDVISHLIANDYTDTEILVECLTYGTAGMVTTREFIVFATWHLLENGTLREKYLGGNDTERHQILEEILRVDPIVSHLYRRATEDIVITDTITIPAGALIDLHIDAANIDKAVFGENADSPCPMRELPRGVLPPAMSFGDGAHRCPGAYLAIQESDMFLRELLAIPTLKLKSKPTLHYRNSIAGYEVRDFIISVGD